MEENIEKSKSILLIEAEPIIAIDTASTIKKMGYDVVTAHSGKTAIDLIRKNANIGLVLMDIDLGTGMDGTETAKKILLIKNIPIVFLTAHAQKEMVEKVRGITRYGYVIKNSGDFVLQSSIEMAFDLFNAYQRLEESENKYSAVFNGAEEGILMSEIETRCFAYANPAICNMLGYSREELLKLSVMDIHPQDKLPEVIGLFNAQARGELKLAPEIPCKRKNGTIFYADINSAKIIIGNKAYNAGFFTDVTERKKKEDEVAANSLKLQSIIDASMDALALTDANGLIIDCNKALCKRWGIPKNEITGFSARKILPEIIYKNRMEHIRKAIDTGKYYHFIDSYKDRWFENTISPILENNGIVQAAAIFSRDITEQKNKQEELLSINRRLNDIIESLPDSTFIIDIKGKVLAWNAAIEKMTGAKKEDMLNKDNYEYSIPFYGKRQPILIDLLDKSDEEIETNYKYVKRVENKIFAETYIQSMYDGRGAHLWGVAVPLYDKDGNRFGSIELIRDVTDYIHTGEELVKSEARYRNIVENINDALYIHDLDGKIFDVNENACSSLGYTRSELIGANLSMIDSSKDAYLIQKRMDTLTKEKSIVFECTHLRKNGTHINVIVSSKLVSCEGNGIIYGFARDMTEIKKLEETLNTTQKLESLGILAGGIAHDFNNLLGGIYGYLDIARNFSTDPVVNEYLDSTLNTMNRAINLTQQLLTFAKGGAPVLKTGNLQQFIEDSSLFASRGSNVLCKFDLPDDILPCDYDSSQMSQVIDNIVINACQAMPMGGEILISARNIIIKYGEDKALEAGRYVKISIQDNGIGISDKIIGKIFDPFFTTKQKGSGLGLATCFSIVKRHGGAIEVESKLGQGTTFHIILPVSDHDVVELPLPEIRNEKRSGRILVMDDEKVIRDTLRIMLEHNGYTVETVEDGSAVIRLYKESSNFKAIIVDLTIPGGKGGLETLDELKKNNLNIPVFVTSGYSEDPVIANPQKYGFAGSIKKPFTQNELISMLKNV